MEYDLLVPILVAGGVVALLLLGALIVLLFAWLQDFNEPDYNPWSNTPDYHWNSKKVALVVATLIILVIMSTGLIPGWVS